MSDFENAVLRLIERHSAGRHNKRAGLVTSWNSKKHLAKVMFQPEGHETGPLPTHSMAAGNGYGHMTGLMAGDGKTTGDHVEVVFQEGDFETGAIVSRIHSEVDAAPEVQSGEQLFSTPFGQSLKLGNDKSVSIAGASNLKADMTDTSHISVPTNKIIYLGGDGTTGTYDFVSTPSGPSINVKVRTG